MLDEMASLERFVCGQSVEHRMLYEGTTAKLRMILSVVSKGKWIGPGLISPDVDSGAIDAVCVDRLQPTDRDILEYISAYADVPLPEFWSAAVGVDFLQELDAIAARVVNMHDKSPELYDLEADFANTISAIESNFFYYRELCKVLSILARDEVACSLLEDLFGDDPEDLIESAFNAVCGKPFHTLVDRRIGRSRIRLTCSATGLSWHTVFHTLDTACGLLRTAIAYKHTA